MACPIFTQSEDCFCLHENCRYYDGKNQKCTYGNNNINEQRPFKSLSKDTDPEYTGKTNEAKSSCPEQSEKKVKLSAKELWDSLSVFHHENGIPRYDELIKDLIKVVSTTQDTHYLTQRDIDFWFQKIEGLEHCTDLQILLLERNKISNIKGIELLPNLRELSLDDNNLNKIFRFEKCPNLENLNLFSNNISEISGLDNLI